MTIGFKPSAKLRPLLTDPSRPFIHRDLSWLHFNDRVLAEALLDSNPLLERAKFLSISASNLDEFFMIRMASLGRSIAAEMRKGESAQLSRLRRIRAVILSSVSGIQKHQAQALGVITQKLGQEKIHIVTDPQLTGTSYALGKKLFSENVLPELGMPEPFAPNQLTLLENLQTAAVFDAATWVRVPRKMKSVMSARDEATGAVYIYFLDWLLSTYLGPSLGIERTPVVFRLTRDADLTFDLEEEDPESIPEVVRSGLGKREKGRATRLQYRGPASSELLRFAHEVLKLSPQQIIEAPATLGLHRLWSAINGLPAEIASRDQLSYPPFESMVPREFREPGADLFALLQKRDYLLHHPYDSFDAYVAFIRTATEDPLVTSIQQTVYRMDALSPVVELLKQAASGGKSVRVVIELRARFDELNNLRLADELRKAGVEVTFGFGNLKIHAKVALVTRKEGEASRLYAHLSTGNYNSVTARMYEDLAILTANQEVGEDVARFFDSVWKQELPSGFKRLVAAPTRLHRRIIQLIDAEIASAAKGGPARVFAKCNSLVDEAVIQHLYDASQRGVKIDLVVRGACSLVPGVKGLSENIRVYSIIDRFLEHSRIYYFESSRSLYLSSADWMPRNFFSRLELAFPVYDDALYSHLEKVIIPAYLSDTTKGRELDADGVWTMRKPPHDEPGLRSQFYFEQMARQAYRGTPLE